MSVMYLYGFVPEDAPMPPGGLLGIADTEVERIDGPGFGALVSRVESDEYAPDALEKNCADVEWMAEQGLTHEQVVAWFVDHAWILPSRLLTLFSGDDSVRAMMERESDRIRSEIQRLDGLREWDLRVGHDPKLLLQHLGEISREVGRLDREIETASPGKRFLLEKKRKDLARTEGRDAASRLGQDLLDSLRPFAREVLTIDPPADATPSNLNVALLVDAEGEVSLSDGVAAARARLEPLGLTLALTGPWAPYRFMHDDG